MNNKFIIIIRIIIILVVFSKLQLNLYKAY